MLEVLENLNENLKQQVSLYAELHNLEREKQRALMQNNLEEIEAITARQEPLLLAATRLEKERHFLVEHIARNLGKAGEELTLAELAEHFPLLERVRLELEKVVGQLQEIQQLNRQLLQEAMRIVEYTLGLLTHQANNTYTYPNRQDIEANKKRQLMEWRI